MKVFIVPLVVEEEEVSNYNRFIDINFLVLQEFIVIPQSTKAHPVVYVGNNPRHHPVPIKFLWEDEFIS